MERLAPRQKPYGPARIFIADLTKRDVTGLVSDEKAEATLDDDRIRLANRIATVGKLDGFVGASIHGGGESLSHTLALSNFQPLTEPDRGLRVHNSDLLKLCDFIEPRLRCQQLVILTVCN